MVLVSFLDPTNPSVNRFQYHMQGGGSGDFCHVSVFSAGIRAESIVLQIRHANCNYTISGYLARAYQTDGY